MLKDLLNVIRSHWFEEGECAIQLFDASLERDVVTLGLHVDLGDCADAQYWKIECIRTHEHQVRLGTYHELQLHRDHVLLWPYIYPHATLSFVGESKEPSAVVGGLHSRHLEMAGHWIPFERFFNGNPHEMIRGHYGMIAEGPTPLLEAYSDVLQRSGLKNGMTEPLPATHTNDSLAGIAEIGLLTLGQESYVIAEDFSAVRVD